MLYLISIIYIVFDVLDQKYSKKKTTKPKSSDAVNHPSHYQKEGKECIQWMEEIYGKISVYFFCILNSYKYTLISQDEKGKLDEPLLNYRPVNKKNAINIFNFKIVIIHSNGNIEYIGENVDELHSASLLEYAKKHYNNKIFEQLN